MTVDTTNSSSPGYGNGATIVWTYNFLIPASGDELITITDNTTTPPTVTVLNSSQYTITGFGNSSGGTVTYPLGISPTPLQTGQNITIARNLPLEQLYVFTNQEAFNPNVVEQAFDYGIMVSQQLETQLSLLPLIPPGSSTTSLSGWIQIVGSAVSSANTSAASASVSATSASNSAASLIGTSSSSLAISTGSVTFVTQTGKQFNSGSFILASVVGTPSDYMHGQVTSYTGSSLVLNVTDTGGSGTFNNWNISVSGSQGAASAGSGTINTSTAGNVAYYSLTGTTVAGRTLSVMIDNAIGSSQGNILYRDVSAWKVLAPGSSGQFLVTGGASGTPSWQASGTASVSGTSTAGLVGYYATTASIISPITLSALIDASVGSTQGSIITRGASMWGPLTPGVNGQFLMTQGAGQTPLWSTPSVSPPTAYGAVGTYTVVINNDGVYSVGNTYSSIPFIPAGTWRCMGIGQDPGTGNIDYLFVRVS